MSNKSNNPWLNHVNNLRTQYPNLSYKEILSIGSDTYTTKLETKILKKVDTKNKVKIIKSKPETNVEEPGIIKTKKYVKKIKIIKPELTVEEKRMIVRNKRLDKRNKVNKIENMTVVEDMD